MGILFISVVLCMLMTGVQSCGVTTHLEIVHRAAEYFDGNSSIADFEQLFNKHRDAFQAGANYPDAFYPGYCFGGRYHDISEDTHWGGFLNATLRYIDENYPPPWDAETEKLVVFVFSLVSHQVADVSWHSLGIPQGFLQTMAKVNFRGSYPTAHTIGDLGGDIVNQYELNTDYISFKWYVPVADLMAIYEDLYGEKRITRPVIRTCTALLFLSRIAEQLGGSELFPWFASKSPFLVDRLDDYFLGGLDDMATWTGRIWKQIIHAIQYGPGSCDIPESVLYMRCNSTDNQSHHLPPPSGGPGRPGTARQTFVPFKLGDLHLGDVTITHAHRGVHIRPSRRIKRRLRRHQKHASRRRSSSWRSDTGAVTSDGGDAAGASDLHPTAVLYSSRAYSRLGRCVKVADVNGDGLDDLVIGAPGYGEIGHPEQGRVYLIMGEERGLPVTPGSHVDIETMANITLVSPGEAGARFGWSVEVLDVNGDQLADVAISAPGSGSDLLQYQGKVYIYFNTGDDQHPLPGLPGLTLSCTSVYCNFGYTLHSADMNRDRVSDLLIGSPFAAAGGEQRGTVSILYGASSLQGITDLSNLDLNVTLHGDQDYEWFGYSMASQVLNDSDTVLLMVGSPTFRHCSRSSCSYSPNDTQSVGRLYTYVGSSDNLTLSQVLTGSEEFGMLGSSLDLTSQNSNNVHLASGSPNTGVSGRLLGLPLPLRQVGSVSMMTMTVQDSGHLNVSKVARFDGNRQYGRFGAGVKFSDVNNDGEDDLLISAPRWTPDITGELYGEEEGVVDVFLSHNGSLPLGNVTRGCPLTAIIDPCPGYKADFRLVSGEKASWFGMSLAVLSHENQVAVVTASPHSSRGARLAGSLSIHLLAGRRSTTPRRSSH